MTSKAPTPGFEPSGQPHDQEARLLVELLRTSRLALLYAEAGTDKTALLKLGVMPLLNQGTPATHLSIPGLESGIARREIVVYFDDWSHQPLAALRESLDRAIGTGPAEQLAPSMPLSEILGDLGRRHDAHLIVLLDRVEDFLQVPTQGAGHVQFANELADAVNGAHVPANFLIALDEAARPRLESLRAVIPGFDDYSLKLASPRTAEVTTEPMPIPESVIRWSIGKRLYAILKKALSRITARIALP